MEYYSYEKNACVFIQKYLSFLLYRKKEKELFGKGFSWKQEKINYKP